MPRNISLSILDLSKTQVSDISALSGLKNLHTLQLSKIEIKDLRVLSGLTALKRLNIQNSKISAIPESILDLNLRFIHERTAFLSAFSDEGIYIHGLTLTDQPIEIFSQNRELIRAYYREVLSVIMQLRCLVQWFYLQIMAASRKTFQNGSNLKY